MESLLIRAKNGDKSAENEIFERLSVRFRLFARQKISNKEAAEDIAQKACLTVLEKYKAETFTVGFEAWAYGVLQMGVRNYFYNLADERIELAGVSDNRESGITASKAVNPGIETQLLGCLKKMVTINRRYARILNLTYQGYKTGEICRKLSISPNNLYVTLNRARAMLWDCLKNREG